MKLLRYILSHGILLLLLVALAFAYYYRSTLFSQEINSHIDTLVDKTTSLSEIFREQQPTETSADEQASKVASLPAESAAPASEEQTPVAEVTSPPAPAEEMVIVETPQPSAQVSTSEADDMPIPSSEADNSAQITSAQPDTSTQAAVVEPQDDQAAAANAQEDLLDQARLAFQNGQMDQAVQLYEKLRELNPDDPNVPGELGNVLYAQGQWQAAGIAYYDAAVLLLEHDQPGQVQYLYRVIQGLDAESAEKLRERLNQ